LTAGAERICGKPAVGLFERLTRPLHDRVDRPGRKLAAEHLTGQLDRVAAGDTVADRERGEGCLEAWTECAARHLGRRLGARFGGAVRAARPV